MSESIKNVYKRRHKKLVDWSKINGAESDSRWVPPTPRNLAPTRRHSEKRALPLSLLSRISGQEGHHEQENNDSLCDSVTVQESAVGTKLNNNISVSGDVNVGLYDSKKFEDSCQDLLENCGSRCASDSPNLHQHFSDCVIAPSDSALTTDISEFNFVASQSSLCNVERSSAEVEKERVFAGDGNNEVLFNDFNGSQTCVSLDDEEKEEKHQNDGCLCPGEKAEISEFNYAAFHSSVCDVERNSADVEKQKVLDPKNNEALFKEERNDFNGLQTCISLDDQEKEGKHQNDGCHNLSEKGFAAESCSCLEHNAKKRRGNSLDEKKPRKRTKIKKIRPKVAFEGRTKNTPTRMPKTVSVKNPSETRQKRKYVRKITSEEKGKKVKKSAGGDGDNAMIMNKNLNHCSATVSSSAASSTKSSTITDSNGCQYNLRGRQRDFKIDPLINYKGTENFPLEYREKKGTDSAERDVDNAMIMDKNLNHCSAITSASAVSSNITNSTDCQYNLRDRQRDLTIDPLIKYKAIDHFSFEYRKKRIKRRKKLHCFFSFLPSRCVTKKKKENLPCFFSLRSFGRVTKRRSKRPTRKVELASFTVIPEGDQMLNAGLEQTELKSELDYSKCVTKKRSKWPTRKVELASCAVIPDGEQMLNVGLEQTELNSELAHCTLISNGDQMLDVAIDQSSQEIDFDLDYLYCKESLIAPLGQTLNGDMEDFLPAHELVHEEMTGHFPGKPLLFEDASKIIFGIELVNFLGRAVASEDKAETICGLNEENREVMDFLGRAVSCDDKAETLYGTNEENREVMDFLGRAVASEDRAQTIYRITKENREVNSAERCLQLGLGPAGALWSCEANMTGHECSQVILKSTGIKSICHEPKTPVKINENNALVPCKGSRKKLSDISHNGAIVPVSDKRKFLPKVLLDEESLRMWELTVRIENGLGSEEDYKKDAKLKEDVKVFQGRIESFTSKMHLVLGDRRFKEWKGSVVDSVVGVFLTQNVSDTLSSSAYMSLAAKYPVQSSSNQGELDEDLKNMHIHGSQYYVTMPEVELNFEFKNKLENPMDACIEDLSKSYPYTSDSQRDENFGIIEESATVINTCSRGTNNLSKDEHVLDIGTRQPDNGKERTSLMGKKKGDKNKYEEKLDWDSFRRQYERPRTKDQMDSVDWEAVRSAEHCEVASTIKCRGQHTILAGKIQEFLNRLRELHNSIDLEWLRYAPPHIAKKYLLEINGVGLKSTECIRLLELQHIAFPVDTNVGRIAVRLGWVPLKTLPGNLELHLLSDYPPMDEIQKYLWPRLRKLGQRRLYELHYHMITFGKVFCTKRNPNCNACPMRAECRHFASAFASANFRLPGPSNEGKGRSEVPSLTVGSPDMHRNSAAFTNPTSLSLLEPNTVSVSDSKINYCQPIVEEPQSPTPCEQDIEDFVNYDNAGCNDEEIPTIKLSNGDFNANVQNFLDKFHNSVDNNMSRAIVPVSVEAASIPARRQKHVTRLRTEHQVYEIPDNHELLEGLDKRESDDPVPYLLAIWTPGETAYSCELPTKKCNTQGLEQLCDDSTCLYCETIREERADIVRGTILIPCRTALKANFPLNGTYFQVNEVFADHETSYKPINVARRLIWNFRRRTVLVGTSTSSIFNGMLSIKEIQEYFWRGYVCVRGIDRKTRAPKPLSKRFHCPPSKMEKTKKKVSDEKDFLAHLVHVKVL